jgi:two-component system sensor histidine kinase KdpD
MSVGARIDHVRTEDLLDEPVPTERAPRGGVSRRNKVAGLVLAVTGLPLVTLLLDGTSTLSLEGDVLVYLLLVVIIALVGGMLVALASALAAALLINYFFVTPVHTFDIAHGDQVVALFVFVAVAGIVSGAVELANRRARLAELALAQAETLSTLAGADLDETDNMESVVLKQRDHRTNEWRDAERAGWGVIGADAPLRFDVPITHDLRLVGRGPALFAEDQRVLRAFAAAAQTAFEGRQLTERAREAESLAAADRQRTALLAAVGHDLRTPLAGVKAAVSSLRQTDVAWSDEERDELLATIEESADRLTALVNNLLDSTRLAAGTVTPLLVPIGYDEVAVRALAGLADAGRVELEIEETLPDVLADAGLLERVVANVVDNALRYGKGAPVVLRASAYADRVELRIVDYGPGVPKKARDEIFAPFMRLDGNGPSDRDGASGVGLGLSVARGFTEVMGGTLTAEDTPGGGLTVVVSLPAVVR